ncbi:MAG: zinc-ribbon domain-containing protein [Acidimicrobiia bacterium]
MDSQTCRQCGAEVAADEQFCPECGTFIDPMAAPGPAPAAPPPGNVISVTSDGNYEEFSLEPQPQGASAEDLADGGRPCPSCGAVNPIANRHCQECGARLNQEPLPTAPRPAVQATAGVRAALAISGLLFIVVVVALLFNAFGDNEEVAASTTAVAPTTAPEVLENEAIAILKAECTPPGLGSFACSNLFSGSSAEYQIRWEELAEGDTVKIKLFFSQPMVVTQILWKNIEDPVRFAQNYRARGLRIDAQGSLTEVPFELEDIPGTQAIDYAAVNANWIEITIQSAFQAEVVNNQVFRELAIDEITVIGRPAIPTTEGG